MERRGIRLRIDDRAALAALDRIVEETQVSRSAIVAMLIKLYRAPLIKRLTEPASVSPKRIK